MREWHGRAATGTFFAGDLVGFTAGLFITVLLLVLTLRAKKLPGAPTANVIFAVCALFWSAGGLAHAALLASGVPREAHLVRVADGVRFIGAATFPIPILATWSPFATRSWQKSALHLLQIFAGISAAGIAVALLYPIVFDAELLINAEHVTAWNATFFLFLGAAFSLRRCSTPRAVYFPSLVIVSSVAGASVAMTIARSFEPGTPLPAIGRHLLLLIVLCAFFLFARFRFADVFIRYSVRILLAGVFAMVLAVAARWIVLSRHSGQIQLTSAVHVFGITVVAATLMLLFAFADEPLNKVVNRWLFHSPDYRARSRQLGETLRRLQLESEISCAVEDSTWESLALDGVRVVSLDSLSPSDLPDGALDEEIIELDRSDSLRDRLPLANVEFLVPIRSTGQVSHLLLISPGSSRPGLVMNDLNYLRTIAVQCGNRLDALRVEREAVERRSREALLQQQVTEAELRALRSQVNPHFLFNSLNTIADLIVRDPSRAEEMTLRLADAFRHVLAHSCRSMTSVSDEVAFLRTYLYIEEARFRDRLQVEIDVAAEIAGEQIPSLILQPLVENALKHGLGPKPGPGHLWISAQAEGDQLRLRVEDDGVGSGGSGPARSARTAKTNGNPLAAGLGLSNVAERLKTLYRDRASLTFEPRESGGSCVTLLIPRNDSVRPA